MQESRWHHRLKQALTREKICEVLAEAVSDGPAAAWPLLTEYLQHPEREIQVFVIGLMAQHFSSEASPLLLEILQNSPAWDVREAAAAALATSTHPDLIPQLGELLKSPDWDLTIHSVNILGEITTPACLPWLLNVCQHHNAFVRKRVLDALGHFAWTPEIELALLNRLQDEEPEIVRKAVKALGSSNSWRTFTALQQLMQTSSDPDLQAAIQSSCAFIRLNLQQRLQSPLPNPVEQLELLNGWYKHGAEPGMAEALESQLTHLMTRLPDLPDSDQQHVLATVLELEPAYLEDVQQQALVAMTKMTTGTLPETLSPESHIKLHKHLLKLVTHHHPLPERQRALSLLLQQENPDTLSQLLFLLDEDNTLYQQLQPYLQASAELATQLLGAYMRKSPSPLGRQRVIDILAHNQDIRTLPLMLRLLRETPDVLQQSTLKRAIADFGAGAIPLVMEHLLTSPDLAIKHQGLDILALAPPSAQTSETLVGLLMHAEPEIRNSAAILLKRLNTHTRHLFERAINPKLAPEKQELLLDILKNRNTDSLDDLFALIPQYAQQPQILSLLESIIVAIWASSPLPNNTSDLLMALLHHEQPDVRFMGLSLLSHTSITACLPVVVLLAQHEQRHDIQQQAKRLLEKWPEHTLNTILHQCLTPNAPLRQLGALLQVVEPQWRLAAWSQAHHPTQQIVLLYSWLKQTSQHLLPQLEQACHHSSPAVQAAALEVLGQYPYALPDMALDRLLQSPVSVVRLLCLQLIGKKQMVLYEQAVVNCTDSSDEEVRGQALICLAQLGLAHHLPLILAQLQQATKQQNPTLQRACTEALGHMQNPAALTALQQALADCQENQSRMFVLEALACQASPDATQLLLQAFQQYADVALRLSMIELFGRYQNRVGYRFLIEQLPHWEFELQRKALDILGQAEERWVLPHLVQALEHPDWRIQWTAIEALGHFRAMEALEPLKAKQAEVQGNHHLWGWILRSALGDALEALRQQQLAET